MRSILGDVTKHLRVPATRQAVPFYHILSSARDQHCSSHPCHIADTLQHESVSVYVEAYIASAVLTASNRGLLKTQWCDYNNF
jgi:hypothetical protein